MNLHESIRNDLKLFEDSYNEVTEADFGKSLTADFGDDNEGQTTPEDYKMLETLANFRDLYNQIKSVDADGYAMDEYKERMLRDVYHDLIVSHFTKRSGKRQGIPDLDGSRYNHAVD